MLSIHFIIWTNQIREKLDSDQSETSMRIGVKNQIKTDSFMVKIFNFSFSFFIFETEDERIILYWGLACCSRLNLTRNPSSILTANYFKNHDSWFMSHQRHVPLMQNRSYYEPILVRARVRVTATTKMEFLRMMCIKNRKKRDSSIFSQLFSLSCSIYRGLDQIFSLRKLLSLYLICHDS